MPLRSVSGIIKIDQDAPQVVAASGSVEIRFFPHEVVSALADGVSVVEMRSAGAEGPFTRLPTKNVSVREFQQADSSAPVTWFTGSYLVLGVDDEEDPGGVTISWHTEGMAWMGEISYLFVGDVAEDDSGGGGGGNPDPLLPEPPDVVVDPVPGGISPPIGPLPGGEEGEKP